MAIVIFETDKLPNRNDMKIRGQKPNRDYNIPLLEPFVKRNLITWFDFGDDTVGTQ